MLQNWGKKSTVCVRFLNCGEIKMTILYQLITSVFMRLIFQILKFTIEKTREIGIETSMCAVLSCVELKKQ